MPDSVRNVTAPTRIPIPGHAPEDVVIDRDGWVVAGVADGRILRVHPGTGEVRLVAHTGGRPLGLEALPDGRLLVCDSYKGLLEVNADTGEIRTLVAHIDGEPLRFCSNVVMGRDGTIYFSESTRRYHIDRYRHDLIENIPTGRLFRRHPDGQVEVLVEGLHFANGLALAEDESFVLVAESGNCRLQRVWLKGLRAGQSEVFYDGLPGMPDNMARGSDGLFWLALATTPNPALHVLHKMPLFVRRLAARLPETLMPEPERLAWVIALDGNGTVIHNLRWSGELYSMVTGVCEHQGLICMGSLAEAAILTYELP